MPLKRRKRRPGGGRKPSQGIIRMMSVGRDHEIVRFSFSEDIIETLAAKFAARFPGLAPPRIALPGYDPLLGLRLLLMPSPDPAVPAIQIRIEPPGFRERGHRIWRANRRFLVQVKAGSLGIDDGCYAKQLDYVWFDPSLLLIVILDPGDLIWTGPTKDVRQTIAQAVADQTSA